MAKLTATTWDDLNKVVRQEESWKKIGHNTHARFDPTLSCYVIRLHSSEIVQIRNVRERPDNPIAFTLAGYNTVTTRERVNQFLRPLGYSVFTRKYVPYMDTRRGELEIDSHDWHTPGVW